MCRSALFSISSVLALGSCIGYGDIDADEAEYEALKAAGAVMVNASLSPTAVRPGDEVSLLVTVASTRTTTVDVLVDIGGPLGASVYALELDTRPISRSAPIVIEDALVIKPSDPHGAYTLSAAVRHTGTGKMLILKPSAAGFIAVEGQQTGACSGTSIFCDDYSNPDLAAAYTTQRGTWTRSTGAYTVTDSVEWERARALLPNDYTDFDVTLAARSLGDAGFGLSYASEALDDGFAVIVHPAQFQGVYLKELVPESLDVNLKWYKLPAPAPGVAMTLRVRREGTSVTVWLDGTQVLAGDDGGEGRHGRLGLVLSVTDETSGAGAEFSLLRLDSATP